MIDDDILAELRAIRKLLEELVEVTKDWADWASTEAARKILSERDE